MHCWSAHASVGTRQALDSWKWSDGPVNALHSLDSLQEAHMKLEGQGALAPTGAPLKHQDVTDLILLRKMRKKLKWTDVATAVGRSKEWTTAACMGQMQMTEQQAL